MAGIGRLGRIPDVVAVLVILVVLGAVLSPPLVARGTNARCVCQDNLKALVNAVQMYWNDYDATLPSSFLYGRSKTWRPDDFVTYASVRGQFPPPEGATVPTTYPMALYPYLTDTSVLWCPLERPRTQSASTTVSYYWKAAVDRAWYARLSRESDFLDPSEHMILFERSGRHVGRAPRGLTNGVVINCAWFDGHVGSVEIRNSGYSFRERFPGPLPLYWSGEPAWFNYSYGEPNPRYNTGANWDPMIWCDKLREVASPCQDNAATCLDNVRRIALGTLMYTSDWDGRLPSSQCWAQSPVWNADSFTHFASMRGDIEHSETSVSQTWPMLLRRYGVWERVLWCPSDSSRSESPNATVSYFWKAAVDAAWHGGPNGSGAPARMPEDFLFPQNQMLIYERSGWHYGGAPGSLADGVVITGGFLDGHAAPLVISQSGYSTKERPAGPLPASGVGEPAWFNYSYGEVQPSISRDTNWNPRLWGDKLCTTLQIP